MSESVEHSEPQAHDAAVATLPRPAAALVPEEPPDPDWLEAEAVLGEQAEAFTAHVAASWQAAREEANARVVAPLQAVLGAAAEAHRTLMEALVQPAVSDEPDQAAALWSRVRAYREGVQTQVLEPLRKGWPAPGAGARLVETFETLLAAFTVPLATAPEAVEVPEPTALYEPAEADTTVIGLRKRTTRLGQRARMQRLQAGNRLRRLLKRPERTLPARSVVRPYALLLAYHARVRVPALMVPVHEAWQQQVGKAVAGVEAAWAEWTRTFLKAERALDRPLFHGARLVTWAGFPEPPAEGMPEKSAETMIDDIATLQAEIQAVAEGLQKALGAPVPQLQANAMAEALAQAADAFDEDLYRGGTFLLAAAERALPSDGQEDPVARLGARGQQWASWHQHVLQRLELNQVLLRLRHDVIELQEELLASTAELALTPIFERFGDIVERLRAIQADVEAATQDAAADPDAVAVELQRIQAEAVAYLQHAVDGTQALVEAEQHLERTGRREADVLKQRVEQVPEVFTVHVPVTPSDAPIDPGARTFVVPVREVATTAMSIPLGELLADPAQKLRNEVLRVWSETEQIQSIVQYNLEAGIEELGAPGEEAEPGTSHVVAARELGTEGVRRAAEMLATMPQALHRPWHRFSKAVFEALTSEWDVIRRRLQSDDFVEQRWVGFRAEAGRQVEHWWRQLRAQGAQRSAELFRMLRFGRRQAKRLIERGQSAVGVLAQDEAAQLDTTSALAARANLLAGLPLVYRKLFSFEPVTVPTLMEGRARDLVRVRTYYQGWADAGTGGALILPMPLGSGSTSLLNAVRTTALQGADVRTLTLTERPADEAAFVSQLAAVLGIDGVESLQVLEAHLTAEGRATTPRVCLIDNLEHLLLRAPGGMDLLERVLIFLSRTDPYVFWCAAIGVRAWHFVERTAGAASGLVSVYRPSPLDREALEAIIVNRHRRSGMPLRFLEPPDPSPILRQRLHRAKTPEARQALLREDFFDRLYRSSGENVMLALFYWLRSVDFKTQDGALAVQPLKKLDFTYLNRFDLARAFTLQAFILHHTLTLQEHNRIFRMQDAQSTFLLESLLNLLIIEPVPGQGETATGPIMPGVRYRINPLLMHPILELLHSRHIVY